MAASLPTRVPVKIAVRLPNWLGDTVMAVPAIRSLRETFPGAPVLLAGPWVQLLAGQGLGDVLVSYPRAWSARLRAADTVRGFGADTVVLLPTSFEAAASAIYWGGRRRIGFAGDARRWLLTDAPPLPEPRLHQVDEYLRLVGVLDAVATAREPRLTPPEPYADARQRVRDLLLRSGAPEGKPMVGVHLGAAYGPAKVWVRERVVEFCRLGPSLGVVPVLLGAPSDEAEAAAVQGAAPTVSLVGRDSPELLPSVLAEMAALVMRRHGGRAPGGRARHTGRHALRADRPGAERAARSSRGRTPRGAVRAVLLPRVPDRSSLHARDLGRRGR